MCDVPVVRQQCGVRVMVAYSFQRRFIDPILTGTKRQTIRADRKRHAHPGEELQLYAGMRTRSCQLITRARCIEVVRVNLCFSAHGAAELFQVDGHLLPPTAMEHFAKADGFASVREMAGFWFEHHAQAGQSIVDFDGVMIRWVPLAEELAP
ncbi:hypothetical protein [Salinarimonas soli]|uniref:ASCH domain-containing protein n=1 Tax=Salinarimonas soli TaxID=1638099 RepID=A0A5B2VFH6_9HYPH|nr:hypothetical protein [Salinarimonas soli]KAA2237724.1 hypothetical protein F0L46_08585 [Salinarimonas soli]